MADRDHEEHPPGDGASAARPRPPIDDAQSVAEEQILAAQRRGDFDDLPGAGRPLDLGPVDAAHDRDWWLRDLVRREQIVLLPESVQLRRDDAGLDDALDALFTEDEVRAEVDEFNRRVLAARYGDPGGPPLVTMPRDVEATLRAWRERRAARVRQVAAEMRPAAEGAPASRPASWWRRLLGRGERPAAGR